MLPCSQFLLCFSKGDSVDGVKCLLTTRGKHTNLLWATQCLQMANILLKPQVPRSVDLFPSNIDSIIMRNQQRVYIDQKNLAKIISFLLNNLRPILCCSKFIFEVNKYPRVTKDMLLWCKHFFAHYIWKTVLFKCWYTVLRQNILSE